MRVVRCRVLRVVSCCVVLFYNSPRLSMWRATSPLFRRRRATFCSTRRYTEGRGGTATVSSIVVDDGSRSCYIGVCRVTGIAHAHVS